MLWKKSKTIGKKFSMPPRRTLNTVEEIKLAATNWEGDAAEVLKEEPWNILGYLMILREYDSTRDITKYDFTHQVFCVQFQELKLEHLEDGMIDKMCGEIGKRMEVDPENAIPKVVSQTSLEGKAYHTADNNDSQIGRDIIMERVEEEEKDGGSSVCYPASGVLQIAANQINSVEPKGCNPPGQMRNKEKQLLR
ncbi:hypothetical protein C5167_044154 [Papaver somniferum]|uniref:Uncharacterized protein n=1 Tax=Papaver somniferum TaxID=3469 RepID=A0A4Y7L8L7_PAPSO|nr:hypothetical protein C5167_044154 [Papaver somniferum]